MPMKFCGNGGFASLRTRCVWFGGLSQRISFIVLWLSLLTCFYLHTGMHTSSAKKLARSQVNGKNYVEYTPFRLPKWISEFKCTFSYCIELYWSTLTIFLYGIPFPKIHVSEEMGWFGEWNCKGFILHYRADWNNDWALVLKKNQTRQNKKHPQEPTSSRITLQLYKKKIII